MTLSLLNYAYITFDMVIFVDQDNVLTDFVESVVYTVEELYGPPLPSFSKEDLKSYDVFKQLYPNQTQEQRDEMVKRVFDQENFWLQMNPLPNAVEVFEDLCSKHDVYIATCPWRTSSICIPEKIAWVKKYLPFFNISRLIFCCHKKVLSGDVIIDDSPVYLSTHNCKHAIAFDYPYNRDIRSDFRAKTWDGIRSIFIENFR